MTALAALNRARSAWERTQPQLFLELWPLDETPDHPTMGVGGLGAGVSSSGLVIPPGLRGRSTQCDSGHTAIPVREARGVPAGGER